MFLIVKNTCTYIGIKQHQQNLRKLAKNNFQINRYVCVFVERTDMLNEWTKQFEKSDLTLNTTCLKAEEIGTIVRKQ
jgi:hypothetical protein